MNQNNLKQKYVSIIMILLIVCSGLLSTTLLNSNLHTVEAASSWIQTSDSDFNNGTLNNVTIMGSGEEAKLRLDVFNISSWTEKFHVIKPIKRLHHAMATVWGTDKVLLFGGSNGSSPHYNDTWEYDLSDNMWINKTPQNKPSSRWQHAMASIHGTDKVVLFGGGDNEATVGDTWVYDLSDNTWINKTPMNKPSARSAHAMATIYGTDKVLLFGGTGMVWYHDDTWIYDYGGNIWTQVTNGPNGRFQHAMASVYGTDKVVLFGGFDFEFPYLNDTWIYDLSDDNWTEKKPAVEPPSMISHAMAPVYGTDDVLLFCGPCPGYSNVTWLYDLSDNNWTKKILTINPNGRQAHAMASIWGTDKTLLFGGGGAFNPYQDDTWIFDLFEYMNNGVFISAPYNTGTNSTFKTLTWSANTTRNTSIKFQLRTAAVNPNLTSKAFVGPNGNKFNFYTSSPSPIWSGHHGDKWMQYKIYLNTTNDDETPRLHNVTISFNCWPDTTLISPPNDSIIVNNTVAFKWNFTDSDSDNQSAFQVLIDDDIEFKTIDFDSGDQSSINHTWQFPNGTDYTNISDGILYWKVRTKDNDGDWGLYSNPWKMIIDSKTPSSMIIDPIDNRSYNRLNTISGITSEPLNGTGIDKVEISITRIGDNKHWDGYDWSLEKSWLLVTGTTNWYYDTSSVLWTSGSNYNVRSRALDNASNIEIPGTGKVFTIDMENVIFTNGWPLDNDVSPTQEVEFGITISDTISGVNASTIQYAVSFDRGKTWNPWKTVKDLNNKMEINVNLNLTFPNGSGNWIQWRAMDIAGNGPKQSMVHIVKVNTWQPTLRVKLLSPENGSIFQTNTIELYWMLKNNNILNISYDIYLDTINPPAAVNQSGVINTSLIINDLTNGKMYYWTVIPKIGSKNGTCISGIWSFTVNLPSPSVTLISPVNGSTISSRTPTLMWSLEYEGTETVKYEVYFENNMEPKLLHNGYPNTYFSPRTILEYNMTYYWQIVPNASGIKGPPSELWSFTVEQEDYSPHFELKLEIEPAVIELMTDERKYVKAIVTNLGNLTDTISLRIWVPPDTRVGAMVNEPNIMGASPKGIAEFNIMVIAFEDAEQDEISLRVVAISETAAEYNLTAVKETTLIVKINIVDMDTEKNEQDNSFSLEGNWYLFFIVIIIILILIVLAIIIIRKKRNDNELPSAEVVTAKSEEILVPETISGQVPTTSAPVTAPPGNATTPVGDTPQLAVSTTTTPVPIPKLVKTIQTTQVPQAPAQIQQPQVPQLPPAQVQIQAQVQTSTPAPVVTFPTPQVVQQPQEPQEPQEPQKEDIKNSN